MGRFDFDKHGYNPTQVDKYINNLTLKYEEKLAEQKDMLVSLKSELDMAKASLAEYKDKDQQISRALMMAVEKAEQIENTSKRIYGLEIKRVRLLYNRWEVLLEEIENRYPNLATTGKTKILLKDFKQSIEEVLQQNSKFGSVRDDIKATTTDTYIRNILNRMDYVEEKVDHVKKTEEANKTRKIIQDVQMKVVDAPKRSTKANPTQTLNETVIIRKKQPTKVVADDIDFANYAPKKVKPAIEPKTKNEPKVQPKARKEIPESDLVGGHKKENNRVRNFKLPTIDKSNKKGNIIDNYLDDETNDRYANIIAPKKKKKEQLFEFAFPEPNETGYDYKDAMHPKEELDEIMKSFDFYKPNED